MSEQAGPEQAGSKVIIANWKMFPKPPNSAGKVDELTRGLAQEIPQVPSDREIIICPPALFLERVARALQGTGMKIGTQNLYQEPFGAFTGETSADMFRSVGCTHAIIAHSERRTMGETNQTAKAKVQAALDAGLSPILCVGEQLEERSDGRANEVVGRQIMDTIGTLPKEQVRKVIIAYEPRWAIGSGKIPSLDDIGGMHGYIRGLLEEWFQRSVADDVKKPYGGSVKPGNAAEILGIKDVDGVLVGGESLIAPNFAQIVNAGRKKVLA